MKNRIILTVLILLAGGLCSSEARGEPIDLTASDMFVRTGFSDRWIHRLPDHDDGAWHRVPASSNGNRLVMVRDLPLEGIPRRPFLSLKRYHPMTFTMVTSFVMDSSWLAPNRLPGIHLAQISDNWEIYLNGRLVRGEMHIDKEGRISSSRGMRDVFFPLDPRLLKKGTNILAFRIVGDPTFLDTGFAQSTPHILDDFDALLAMNSEWITLVLLFLYLFAGIYHLFLFVMRRADRHNLYYGLFATVLFIYLFMRTHTVYQLIPDTNMVFHVEVVTLFAIIPLACLFFDHIHTGRPGKFIIVYSAFCLLLALLTIPTPLMFRHDILRVWQITALVPILYYVVVREWLRFIDQVRVMGSQSGGRVTAMVIVKALTGTVEGNLLVGIMVLAGTAVYDIVDAVYLRNDLVLTRYGFFVFVMGTALVLANRFLYVHHEVEILNLDLERKINDLDEANMTISVSEKKYRLLVEGSNDLIFSLDRDLRFITVNRAMMKRMRMDLDEFRDLGLKDLLFFEEDEQEIGIRLVREKIDEFFSRKNPVNFKVKLKSPAGPEPHDYHLRLEHVDIEGKSEVLGKAIAATEDALLDFFASERQSYSIKNHLIVSDEISHRMVRNLFKFLPANEISMVRMGLREMIINAIEHGNLEISFDEKSRESMNDNYLEFVGRRQKDPRFRDRRVAIDYSISSSRAVFRITDEGIGFDHKKMTVSAHKRANEGMLAHGRGIVMALNIFDQVTYNRRGNQVLMVKKLSGEQVPRRKG
ncbi:MAG TPA: hypothetical protein ENN21_06910 [Spirochaetes bacterium]|nr:hypothetical protein [Spirochaetota bacterium]